jgi:glycosyltransferase involved in cell wall biosynthesis
VQDPVSASIQQHNLSAAEMARIRELASGHRLGPDTLVFAEGDSQALAHHIHQLSSTPDTYATLSHSARQHILTKYTQFSVAQQYWQIYKQIINLQQK